MPRAARDSIQLDESAALEDAIQDGGCQIFIM
jgi:hypothetical protein